jgi:hypothetical protein
MAAASSLKAYALSPKLELQVCISMQRSASSFLERTLAVSYYVICQGGESGMRTRTGWEDSSEEESMNFDHGFAALLRSPNLKSLVKISIKTKELQLPYAWIYGDLFSKFSLRLALPPPLTPKALGPKISVRLAPCGTHRDPAQLHPWIWVKPLFMVSRLWHCLQIERDRACPKDSTSSGSAPSIRYWNCSS